MKKHIYLSSLLIIILLSSCKETKPPHHPQHPNYDIIKPEVKYDPTIKNLKNMVKNLQGSPYVWAEEGPNTFDCSGFTYYMYGSMGIEIPRVAREQAKKGKKIPKNKLQYGDLIFFATSKKSYKNITHVGMYLGDGWFTHASTVTNEVIYSNLNTSKYYKKKLRICRRYLPDLDINLKTSPLLPQTTPFKVVKKNKEEYIEETKDKKFYIQIGSFKSNPSTKLLYTIKRLGFNYKVIRFKTNKKSITKLFIGHYTSRKKALEILSKVKNKLKPSAFIVQIR